MHGELAGGEMFNAILLFHDWHCTLSVQFQNNMSWLWRDRCGGYSQDLNWPPNCPFVAFFYIEREEQVNSFSQTDNKMSGWWHINTFPPWYSQNASCWTPQLMQGTVPQWYKSNSLSLLTQKVEIDPVFLVNNHGLLCLDRNANRKAGSGRSHRLCGDICGLINKDF